jgi:hypothetical protein
MKIIEHETNETSEINNKEKEKANYVSSVGSN